MRIYNLPSTRVQLGGSAGDNGVQTSYGVGTRGTYPQGIYNGTYSECTLIVAFQPNSLPASGNDFGIWGFDHSTSADGVPQLQITNGSSQLTSMWKNDASISCDFGALTVGVNYIAVLQYDGGGAANADRLRLWLSADGADFVEQVGSFTGTIPGSFTLTDNEELVFNGVASSGNESLNGLLYDLAMAFWLFTDDERNAILSPQGYFRHLSQVLTPARYALVDAYVCADTNQYANAMIRQTVNGDFNSRTVEEPGIRDPQTTITGGRFGVSSASVLSREFVRENYNPAFDKRIRAVNFNGSGYFESADLDGFNFYNIESGETVSETVVGFQFECSAVVSGEQPILGARAGGIFITAEYTASVCDILRVGISDSDEAAFDLDALGDAVAEDTLTGIVWFKDGLLRVWCGKNRAQMVELTSATLTGTSFTPDRIVVGAKDWGGASYATVAASGGWMMDVICPGAGLGSFRFPVETIEDWADGLSTNIGLSCRYSPWGEVVSWCGFGRHKQDDATATTGLIRNMGSGSFGGLVPSSGSLVGDIKSYPAFDLDQGVGWDTGGEVYRTTNTGGTASEAGVTEMYVFGGEWQDNEPSLGIDAFGVGGTYPARGEISSGFGTTREWTTQNSSASADRVGGPMQIGQPRIVFRVYDGTLGDGERQKWYVVNATTGTLDELNNEITSATNWPTTVDMTGQITFDPPAGPDGIAYAWCGWLSALTPAQMLGAIKFIDGERSVPKDLSSYLSPWFVIYPAKSASPTTQWDDQSANANHLNNVVLTLEVIDEGWPG